MNYAKILKCDIANGTGFRVSLFVSGCARKCPGCQNQEAQDPDYGKPFDDEAKAKIYAELEKPYCRGLSLLGGEPMSKLGDIRQTVIALCREVRERFPDKDIWMWSGYTYQELLADDTANQIFNYIDYLVDGPFVEGMKDLSLRFRGSANQRIVLLRPKVEDVTASFDADRQLPY